MEQVNSWDALDAKYGGGSSGARSGASDWDALDKKYANVKAPPEKPKAEPVSDFKGNLRLGPIDTGIPLPEPVNRRLAQLGSGFADAGLAGRQIMASPAEDAALRQEKVDKAGRDASLNTDFTGKALHFGGKVLPLMAVPTAGGPVAAGAAAGALGGALEPVGPGESRGANVAMGAGLGMAVPGVVAGVRNMLKPSADVAAVGQKALQYGIPVSPADLSGSRMVKATRAITNELPIVGYPGQRLSESQQTALNKAVGSQFGAAEAKLTPDVMDVAAKRMGSEFDRIWGQNNLQVDSALFQKMQAMRASAADLPKEQASRVIGQIDDLWSRAQPGPNGAPTISGETANKFQQWLRERGAGNDAVARDAQELRKAVLSAFNRSVSPQDAAALTLNRTQYKAFKTVQPLLDKGVAGVAGRAEGDIPASLLPGAVRQSYSNLSTQTATPALADISQVAGRLLTDRTPQTGGSARAMLQNMGLGAAIYGGASNGLMPTAAAVGGATAVNALMNSPRLGAMMLQRQAPRTQADALAAFLESLGTGAQRLPIGAVGLTSGGQ